MDNKIINEFTERSEGESSQRVLNSDQHRMARDLLRKGHLIRLKDPMTANTNMNIHPNAILVMMKKLSLRVNYDFDKNFTRTTGDTEQVGLNRISFFCFFERAWNNDHVHFYIQSPTDYTSADILKSIKKHWKKLDKEPDREDGNTVWHKNIVDADVKRYLDYSVKGYVVDKDMALLPKNEQYETFEMI
jgi:hypothetical protein